MQRRIRSLRTTLLAASLWLVSAGLAAPTPAVELGEPAPAFTAPAVGGGEISLAAYRGKVVYLDFWATWCGPCAQSLPAIDDLRDEFADSDFRVLAINVDRQKGAAQTFLRRRPVSYPSGLDPQGEIPVRFGVQTMPTSFLIDRDGVVRHVHRGFRTSDVPELRRKIQALLGADR